LGGFFSRFGKYLYDKRTRRKKVRYAILSEIKSPKSAINDIASDSTTIEDLQIEHTIPNSVYQAHIDDIGLLRGSEVPQVVDYYSIVEVANEQLESADDDSIESFLDQTSTNLKSARDDAEEVLEAHSRWFGRLQYKLRKYKI
jgi:hypothetical protein